MEELRKSYRKTMVEKKLKKTNEHLMLFTPLKQIWLPYPPLFSFFFFFSTTSNNITHIHTYINKTKWIKGEKVLPYTIGETRESCNILKHLIDPPSQQKWLLIILLFFFFFPFSKLKQHHIYISCKTKEMEPKCIDVAV